MQNPSPRLQQWFNEALFNTPSAARYFDPLLCLIDKRLGLDGYPVTLVGIRRDTHDTASFDLHVHGRWPGFAAGQHVTLAAEIDGRRVERPFTIASAPELFKEAGLITLTIKRNPSGRLGNWLHTQAQVGMKLKISDARGEFLAPTTAGGHWLYVAAGSGITPILSHIRHLATQGFPVTAHVVYYNRTAADVIHAEELASLTRQHDRLNLTLIMTREASGTLEGRLSDAHLSSLTAQTKPDRIFACGPRGFVANLTDALGRLNIQAPLILEAFGGERAASPSTAGDHAVHLEQSRRLITSSPGKTLLELAEDAGARPNAGCRMGICHTCKCTKQSGRTRNLLTGETSDEANEQIQLCISVPESDVTLKI